MRRVICATALVAGLAAPASALAAPGVSVLLDPSTPNAAPVITATVSQDAGDSPASRLTLLFPASFALQQPGSAAACASATSCSRDSEVGSLEASVAGASVAGTLHRASGSGLFALVRGGGPLAGVVLNGSASTRPTGLHAITFEGLPAASLSPLTLRLTGGERGLIRSPSSCGRQVVEARITTHSGELGVAATEVDIQGCAAALSGVKLSGSKLRASKRGRITLRWSASSAAPVKIALERRKGRSWRRVKSLRHKPRAGRNTLRLRGRGLKPGRYRFTLRAAGAAQPVASKRFRVAH